MRRRGKIAIYPCQELAVEKPKDIARQFDLRHIGSISFITHQIRNKNRENKRLHEQIDKFIISIMKQLN